MSCGFVLPSGHQAVCWPSGADCHAFVAVAQVVAVGNTVSQSLHAVAAAVAADPLDGRDTVPPLPPPEKPPPHPKAAAYYEPLPPWSTLSGGGLAESQPGFVASANWSAPPRPLGQDDFKTNPKQPAAVGHEFHDGVAILYFGSHSRLLS